MKKEEGKHLMAFKNGTKPSVGPRDNGVFVKMMWKKENEINFQQWAKNQRWKGGGKKQLVEIAIWGVVDR